MSQIILCSKKFGDTFGNHGPGHTKPGAVEIRWSSGAGLLSFSMLAQVSSQESESQACSGKAAKICPPSKDSGQLNIFKSMGQRALSTVLIVQEVLCFVSDVASFLYCRTYFCKTRMIRLQAWGHFSLLPSGSQQEQEKRSAWWGLKPSYSLAGGR